jgi:ATP-dependent DNA ligase
MFRKSFPQRCVVDGEIVIAADHGLDFDALQLRLHPAESRVRKLAAESPAGFVAFDLLAVDDRDLRGEPQVERRRRLERALAKPTGGVHLTPCSRDHEVARDWFHRFEGAGLDGVIAKHESTTYQPGKRAMVKVKHVRTADCVVAGFRWHKQGPGTLVGSLLLGLYDDAGVLHHVGITSAFTMAVRRRLVDELAPLRKNALAKHPWRDWANVGDGDVRMPGGQSRWSAGKDLSWEPLRIERVCEVKYDHLQRDRFRHATHFLRWRPDKAPADCRYDQLEVTPPAELAAIFR